MKRFSYPLKPKPKALPTAFCSKQPYEFLDFSLIGKSFALIATASLCFGFYISSIYNGLLGIPIPQEMRWGYVFIGLMFIVFTLFPSLLLALIWCGIYEIRKLINDGRLGNKDNILKGSIIVLLYIFISYFILVLISFIGQTYNPTYKREDAIKLLWGLYSGNGQMATMVVCCNMIIIALVVMAFVKCRLSLIYIFTLCLLGGTIALCHMYAAAVFPKLSQVIGGGRPQETVIRVKKHIREGLMLSGIDFDENEDRTQVFILSSDDTYYYICSRHKDGQCIKVKRDDVDLMQYLK